ncbi:hypothetical protein [Alteromonas flava]|uniref:hypothetical protein n=1 Tax=Alteromonas flava TaxID=2048003 RepID=UPI000C2921FC|nr:hypothetical protein [Alteromonas flava]
MPRRQRLFYSLFCCGLCLLSACSVNSNEHRVAQCYTIDQQRDVYAKTQDAKLEYACVDARAKAAKERKGEELAQGFVNFLVNTFIW